MPTVGGTGLRRIVDQIAEAEQAVATRVVVERFERVLDGGEAALDVRQHPGSAPCGGRWDFDDGAGRPVHLLVFSFGMGIV